MGTHRGERRREEKEREREREVEKRKMVLRKDKNGLWGIYKRNYICLFVNISMDFYGFICRSLFISITSLD